MARKSTKQPTPESESSRSASPEVTKKTADSSSSESEQASNSSNESGSDNDSSSSSEEDEQPNKSSSKFSFQAPQPYKAPSGFKSAKKQSPPSSSVSSVVSDLHGKKVFHITAPASLPLSKVKEISLGKVMQGEPVMKYEGVQYGIPAGSMGKTDTHPNILHLYDPKTQTYYPTANNVPSYHVQELISLPDTSEINDKSLETAQKLIKPPRKQPKHLKMRFRPVGSGEAPPETIGTSSEESEGEEPTFKVPKGSSKEERKRKHHHTEAEGAQPSGEPRKKSKKHSSQEGADGTEGKEKKKSSKNKDEKKRKKSEKA